MFSVRSAASNAKTRPPPADRLVEVDDEALVPRRVPGGEDRGDTGGDLAVAIGQAPLDGGVVVVDAEHGVVFGVGVVDSP